MKKWIAKIEGDLPNRFEIEEEEGIGFYLYVYENEKCVRDYLQDTFAFAVEDAEEMFNVPPQAWALLESST